MKIIKFRGKDIQTGKFIYGDLIHSHSEKGGVLINEERPISTPARRVEYDSVAQLIGIDKNGNEIFEGDEIKSCLGSSCYANFRHYGGIIDGVYSLVQTRIIGGKEK